MIVLLILGIGLIGSVSGADSNQTDEIITNEESIDEINTIEINDPDESVLDKTSEEILEVNEDENKLEASYQQFSDIQKKINIAKPGETVYLNGTYYGFGMPIIINKPIKLVGMGEGAELKANTNTNIKQTAIYINETASDVLIENLKISGGCDQWGGAINVWAKRTTIDNCLFKDNSADGMYGYGGAIFLWAENCLVNNCTFTNNHCTDYGGAIYANSLNNKISNCIFKYNYVSNELMEIDDQEGWRGGGAIYSDCQSLIIDNCTFVENHARESFGGALRIAAACRVQNSIFKDNVAKSAKAIYCSEAILDFRSNTFSLQYKEDPNTLFGGITADELKNTNTFNKTRIDSSVKFSAGMIFDYGTSGSIYVTVDGGTIDNNNINVLGQSKAKIDFKNNVITVSNLPVGTYTLRVTTVPDDDHFSVSSDLRVTVKKSTAAIKASKITVAYKKGSQWTIKLADAKSNSPISNMKLTVKVYTGKKYKTVDVKTNSKGEASYQTRGLAKGSHKVVVSASDGRYNFNTLTSSIKVVKQTVLKFKLREKHDDNGGSLRSFVVTNKKTKKGVNGVKIKVYIYTGKKVKTYTLKTKKIKGKKGTYNGAFGFSTNQFSAGKHKVVLKPVSIKYDGSITTSINIKKKATIGPKYFRTL